MKSKFIILVGPSGSGKTAIIEHLLTLRPDLYCARSVTTRKMRSQEELANYIFVSENEFTLMSSEKRFLEQSSYACCQYATPKSEFDYAQKNGMNAIKAMDIAGALSVKRRLGKDCVVLFVYRDRRTVIKSLTERVEKRVASAADIAKRIQTLDEEYNYVFLCDGIIRNVRTIDEACLTILNILDSYHCSEVEKYEEEKLGKQVSE